MNTFTHTLWATCLIASFSAACSDDSDSDVDGNAGALNDDLNSAETTAEASEQNDDDATEQNDELEKTEAEMLSDSTNTTEAAEDESENENDSVLGPDISIATTDEGEVLVNSRGFTLYHHSTDTFNGEAAGVSATWLPVELEDPSLGEGLNANNFAVTSNGVTSHKGLPLYTFANDTEPGDAKGVSGAWPLATP